MSRTEDSSWLRSLFLLLAAVLTLPLGGLITFATYLLSLFIWPTARKSSGIAVLISGDDAPALVLVRHFHRAGHRVIYISRGASATSASNCIDKLYPIQDSLNSQTAYEQRILDIIRKERIDIFVPCTNHASLASHGKLASSTPKFHLMHYDEPTGAKLNRTDFFIRAAAFIGLDVPQTELVTSTHELISVLNMKKRYVLKSLHGGPITVLPTLSKSEVVLQLARIKITPETPFIVQELVAGEPYSCHVFMWRGRVRTYIAYHAKDKFKHIAPLQHELLTSSFLDPEVDLEKLRKSRISQKMQDFITVFAEKYNLTGSLTINFMASGSDILPISSEPFVDASIACFYGSRSYDQAYTRLAHNSNTTNNWPIYPEPSSRHCYSIYEALWGLIITLKFRAFIRKLIREREYIWDLYDPLPFLIHYHFEVIRTKFRRIIGIY